MERDKTFVCVGKRSEILRNIEKQTLAQYLDNIMYTFCIKYPKFWNITPSDVVFMISSH